MRIRALASRPDSASLPWEPKRHSLAHVAAAAARSGIASVLALALASGAALPSWAALETDLVVRVLDANTLKLERLGVVSMAAERTPSRVPDCFTYSPAAHLRQLLRPKEVVQFQALPAKPSGTQVFLYRARDGLFVNEALVEGGWAKTAPLKAGSVGELPSVTDQLRKLETAQQTAKAAAVGLWQVCPTGESGFVDLSEQFEPLGGAGSEFEYFRVAPRAAATAAAAAELTDPGDSVNCSDFETWEGSKQWFDRYYPKFGDVANLDRDKDGVPCPGLPHTARRELYQPKRPRPEFRLPLSIAED